MHVLISLEIKRDCSWSDKTICSRFIIPWLLKHGTSWRNPFLPLLLLSRVFVTRIEMKPEHVTCAFPTDLCSPMPRPLLYWTPCLFLASHLLFFHTPSSHFWLDYKFLEVSGQVLSSFILCPTLHSYLQRLTQNVKALFIADDQSSWESFQRRRRVPRTHLLKTCAQFWIESA